MSTYRIGTVTVNNGSQSVTGSGTAWAGAGLKEGDQIEVNGLIAEIASVQSNTALTLRRNWPGATASGQQYTIWRLDDGARSLNAINNLLPALGGGTLTSLAALNASANQMPFFTGAGVMALTNLTAAARTLLGRATIETTGTADVTAGRLIRVQDGYVRSSVVGTVSQSGGVPTGAVIQRGSNANGQFVRFADGTQICWGRTVVDQSIDANTRTAFSQTFPAAFSQVPSFFPTTRSNNSDLAGELAARHLKVSSYAGPGNDLTTSVIVVAVNTHSSSLTLRVDYKAIGRWFNT